MGRCGNLFKPEGLVIEGRVVMLQGLILEFSLYGSRFSEQVEDSPLLVEVKVGAGISLGSSVHYI